MERIQRRFPSKTRGTILPFLFIVIFLSSGCNQPIADDGGTIQVSGRNAIEPAPGEEGRTWEFAVGANGSDAYRTLDFGMLQNFSIDAIWEHPAIESAGVRMWLSAPGIGKLPMGGWFHSPSTATRTAAFGNELTILELGEGTMRGTVKSPVFRFPNATLHLLTSGNVNLSIVVTLPEEGEAPLPSEPVPIKFFDFRNVEPEGTWVFSPAVAAGQGTIEGDQSGYTVVSYWIFVFQSRVKACFVDSAGEAECREWLDFLDGVHEFGTYEAGDMLDRIEVQGAGASSSTRFMGFAYPDLSF